MTLELDGEVSGFAGVVPCGDYFSPWAVFTDAVDRHPVQFLKDCRRWISGYDVPMLNVVDERNKVAQKWLKWLGFTLGDPVPFGPNNMLFRFYQRGF